MRFRHVDASRLRLLMAALFGAALALVAVAANDGTPAPGTDPARDGGAQWHLSRIGATDATWARSTGSGITIAIVDTGVDATHPDLSGAVVDSVSCLGAAGDPQRCTGEGIDPNGHGTHVAGIAAARLHNGLGGAGVAPDARLMSVRVLAGGCDQGPCAARGDLDDVAAGISWAASHGADVVNLSLESTDGRLDEGPVAQAITAAWDDGVIVVAAAGNHTPPSGRRDLPVVVVAAANRDDVPSRSSTGVGTARWALAAYGGEPGDDDRSCRPTGDPMGIYSTSVRGTAGGDAYACIAGTSMAAPQVSGAAAVLLAQGYSPTETVARLVGTARDVGLPGPDGDTGAGIVDLARASDEKVPTASPGNGPSAAASGQESTAAAGTDGGGRPPLVPTVLAGMALAVSLAALFGLLRPPPAAADGGPQDR